MKLLRWCILALITFQISAQEYEITKSEIFKDTKKRSSLNFTLEDDNGGLVIIRSFYSGMIPRPKGYYIQRFDAGLNLINETEYEIDDNMISNAFIKDDKLHLIEFFYNKKEDKITFSVVSSNINELRFSKRELLSFSDKKLTKFLGIGLFNNGSQFDKNHLGEVVFSTNKNFFAINFDVKNKKEETHMVAVFNSDFQKIFEKTITKNVKDRLFQYNSVDIDDRDGTLYFLGKSFENNTSSTKKDGEANYHFDLYKVNSEGQQFVSFEDKDKFIKSLELIKVKDGLSVVGFYGKRDESRLNGVCLMNIDPESLVISSKKYTPFSDEFLTDKYGNKEGKKKRKKKKGITNIDFKSVFKLENGDIVVNAEEFYITVITTMNANGGTSTRTVYHYDDIMSMRIDKLGNLIWSRNVNKRQTGLTNSSFTSLTVGDISYFFMNASDNIKKNDLGNLYFRNTSSKRSNLYVITIDINGDVDYKKLIDDKDSKVYYKVNNGNVNINKGTAIFIGKQKKNSRILKIKV